MNIEQIRENAPNGATHYLILKTVNTGDHVIYFKKHKENLEIHSSYSGWVEDRRTRDSEIKPLN